MRNTHHMIRVPESRLPEIADFATDLRVFLPAHDVAISGSRRYIHVHAEADRLAGILAEINAAARVRLSVVS